MQKKHSLWLLAPVLATGLQFAHADGADEVEFFIRPAAPLSGDTPALALSVSSDAELSIVASLHADGALRVTTADGRAEGAEPLLGGFGPAIQLSSTAAALDDEAVRVSGSRGIVAWLDDAAGASATAVHVARFDATSGLWSTGTPVGVLPSGDTTDYEVVLTRAPVPLLHVVAVVSGAVWVATSNDAGATFAPASQVSAPGGVAFEVEAEAQFNRLAVVFTDNRGPAGSRVLWSRTAVNSGFGFTFGPEQALSAALGLNARAPQVALEVDLLVAGWLEGDGVNDSLFLRRSTDFGANFGLVSEPVTFAPNSAAVDTVPDFDLEVTYSLIQVAATLRIDGVDSVARFAAVDPAVFDAEVMGQGSRPRFARTEGVGPGGPESQTIVFLSPTEIGETTLLGASADQLLGTEYHDELLPIGVDAGIARGVNVQRFAIAYNRLYDNFIIPFTAESTPAGEAVAVTGYRPLSIVGEDLFPGSETAHLATGHVPLEDAFVAALVSFSRAKGSLLLPDGRDTGLDLDPLTVLGLSPQLFFTSFFAANDPSQEGAELGNFPFLFPGGFEFFTVAVTLTSSGLVRKISDVVTLP